MAGVRFALPRLVAASKQSDKYHRLFAFEKKVAKEPSLHEYFKIRIPFSNGLFRYYEELDGEA
jgi:hypothetical protein